ncbi:MAG: hypothetical protein OEV94_02080 [Deltaproteobacteria bacterium]|nr:hypothetical protein [Deltaproteobacteria bacterium]
MPKHSDRQESLPLDEDSPASPVLEDDLARLNRLARQFLVHSFLYYRLGESVIADGEFDRLTEELRALRLEQPQAPMVYAKVVDGALGPEASGYAIRDYPPPVITAAFKLLYEQLSPPVPFQEFVERMGYRARFHDGALA